MWTSPPPYPCKFGRVRKVGYNIAFSYPESGGKVLALSLKTQKSKNMIKGGRSRDGFLLVVDITWRHRGELTHLGKRAQNVLCNFQFGTWLKRACEKSQGVAKIRHWKKPQSQNLRNLTRATMCTGITLFLWSQHTAAALSAPKPACRTTSPVSPGAMVVLQGHNGTGRDFLGATEIFFPSSCDKSGWQCSDWWGKLCKCMSGLLLHWGESPISDLLEWQL